MKLRLTTIGICIFLIVLSLSVASAYEPYSLAGHTYNETGSPLVGVVVTITNVRTGEQISNTSVAGGEYQEDAANYPTGYENGDTLSYYSVFGNYSNVTSATVDTSAGGTTLDIYLSMTYPSTCKPTNPSPFNGQTNVLTTTTLTWDCPNEGYIVYDIYLSLGGGSPSLVEENYSATTYNPGGLESGKCYCWRIVSKNNNGSTNSGSYWQFCTLATFELFDKDYTSIWKDYSGYNKSDEGCYEGTRIDTDAFINMIPAFYTDKVGGVFWLFIFAIPFILSFIKQESVIIPTILGFLVSGSMFFFLPIEYQTPARSLFYISLAGILYTFFHGRSY